MSVATGTTTAQTPLLPNFGGMKAEVAAYVGGRFLPAVLSDAGAAINSAINKINTEQWKWLTREETLTLVADQREYTIDASFKKPFSLVKRDTNAKEVGPLVYQIPTEFKNSEWTELSSTPEFYTVRNASDDRLLTLNFAPSTEYVASYPTLRLTYYSRMGHFGGDGESLGDLEVPPETGELIEWYAKWKVASTRGTPSQVREAKAAWKEFWVDMRRDNFDEQTDWSAAR